MHKIISIADRKRPDKLTILRHNKKLAPYHEGLAIKRSFGESKNTEYNKRSKLAQFIQSLISIYHKTS